MQLPTNLALSFMQLSDRNGDQKVSRQELANMTIQYYDEYNKQTQAGNTQLAETYRPYIEFGTTAFFGGTAKQGLVPDYNGDGQFGVDELLRLDANKDNTINTADYQAVFGNAAVVNGNTLSTANFESLRQIALGQQFSDVGLPVVTPPTTTPPVTTPPVTPPPTTGGTGNLNTASLQRLLPLLLIFSLLSSGGLGNVGNTQNNQAGVGMQQLLPLLLMSLLMGQGGLGGTTGGSQYLPLTTTAATTNTTAQSLAQQNFTNANSDFAA